MTGAAPPTRLLLVDDTDDLRMLLRVAFEASGRYEVVAEAGDGVEAIEKASAFSDRLDLILLDLAMPRMDGLEALPHLRTRLPQVPVVVLSGFAANSTERAALAAGAALYLEKGLRPAELLAAIDAALGLTAATAPAVPREEAPTDGRPTGGDLAPTDGGPTGPDPVARRATAPVPRDAAPTHEVVAELAHDVRSPLFVAREVVRVLRGAVDDDQLLHLADRAMAAVDRVDATLESAIEHARLGQAPLTLRRHELRGLLVELTATLDARSARRVELRGPAVSARVDRGAFSRVVGNLVDNALRYSDGRVEISTCELDEAVCVCVRDRGPGLGDGDPELLFAAFARGAAGRERAGTGLGLATARRLTERMGGTVVAEDADGGGARFRVLLPEDR